MDFIEFYCSVPRLGIGFGPGSQLGIALTLPRPDTR